MDGFGQCYAPHVTTALLGALLPRVVNENAAHHPGRDGKEVRTVLPLYAVLVDELQIGLVGEGGGLQGVIGTLGLELGSGEAPQLPVDERDELVESLAAPTRRGAEELSDSCLHANYDSFFASATGEASMNSELWARLKPLFETARVLPPSERETIVEKACGDDPHLRAALDSLLSAYDDAGSFLERQDASGPSDRVGGYRRLAGTSAG